ncbi:MAG: hypothetical protein R3F41_00935 [Gammaproteobacteria bacterium]|nr:hypothetical protein [Pseudomonadales bacterium]
MSRLLPVLLVFFSLSAFAQFQVGGSLLDNCSQIDALNQAGNYAEAKEKAQLCIQGIEQQLSGEISSYFLEEIGDWTRTNLEQNQAMGITNISASYEKGSITVNVSLTNTGGGGAGLGGLLGGFAQAGLLGGGQQVTVAGIPSSLSPEGTLMVPLQGGSFLSFESYEFNTAQEAIDGMGDLINDFPVAEINATLQ